MNLKDWCENIDASVFSGELLWQQDKRGMLEQYVGRWQRAIAEHKAYLESDPGDLVQGEQLCLPAVVDHNVTRDYCEHCDTGFGKTLYPYYGTRPHGSGPLPANFTPDPEAWGIHGTYEYCLNCGAGKESVGVDNEP